MSRRGGAGLAAGAGAARVATFALAVAALVAFAFSGSASAELPAAERPTGRSMREMFQGVAVDRCKEIGGPPVAAEGGPAIARLSASEGRPGDAVTIVPASPADPSRPDEVRFLLRGKELGAEVASDRAAGLRATVPDFGVKAPSKGWVHLVRDGKTGRAVPFLFRDRGAGAPHPK